MKRLAGFVLALVVLLEADLLVHIETVNGRPGLHERPDGNVHATFIRRLVIEVSYMHDMR